MVGSDNFDFSDSKKVRKTLLIVSFIGFSFQYLVGYSTGTIEFLGFSLPVEDANVIPMLVGYLIIYLTIVLLIRYYNERVISRFDQLTKEIEGEREFLEKFGLAEGIPNPEKERAKDNYHKLMSISKSKNRISSTVLLIDLIFPVAFALFVLYKIYA